MLKNYGGAIVFAIVAILLGALIDGAQGAYIVSILAILEISLSFDNAVVNASVLKSWGDVWRHRFMTWGLPVAVFGMRLIFPLLIVGIIGHMGPIEVVSLAINSPKEYAQSLTSAHHQIAAFGGTFLMMVFLKFFLDDSKEQHWIALIEKPLTKLARFTEVLVLAAVVIISQCLDASIQFSFLAAAVWGLVTFLTVETLGSLMGDASEGSTRLIKEGIGGFLYLEVLDASFSFDGVIGAFALSENIFIIALGLGVGAMFVRAMTLSLLKSGAMSEFRYLEHGAFWAIGALATIMFLSIGVAIPEIVTGIIGVAAIGTAVWSSILANKKDARGLQLNHA